MALYIESVYDAQFGIAQIGKKLLPAYEQLGGEGAFGASLTKAEAEQLAGAYSEAQLPPAAAHRRQVRDLSGPGGGVAR